MHICLEHAVSKSTTQLQQWHASHTATALVTPLGKHMPQMQMVLTRDSLLNGTLACRSWDLFVCCAHMPTTLHVCCDAIPLPQGREQAYLPQRRLAVAPQRDAPRVWLYPRAHLPHHLRVHTS